MREKKAINRVVGKRQMRANYIVRSVNKIDNFCIRHGFTLDNI